MPLYRIFQLLECLTAASCRRIDRVSAQLVHDIIHVFHALGIDSVLVHFLLTGVLGLPQTFVFLRQTLVAFRQTLEQLVQGGLVVAGGGGESIDGLLASGRVGVCCGESDKVRESVFAEELVDIN